ncbi:S1 family peptidase [Micromonospora sp. CPCC 205371]|nr:S1 family peptidase [Micromonospora sp. CPCC 205371]
MSQRGMRRLAVGGAAAASIMLVVAGSPARAETPKDIDPASEAWLLSAEATAEGLRKQGDGDAAFATIEIDSKTQKVLVYRKGGGASPRYAAARKETGVDVEFRAAPLTEKETYDLIERIAAQRDTVAKRGIEITSVTSRWTGPVTIRVKDLTGAARGLASEFDAYGPGTVVVERGAPMRTFNRDNDTAPFIAGAHIQSTAGFGECTSGFTGRSTGNGAGYMITAYHCVRTADPRFWTTDVAGSPYGSYIGQVTVVDPRHDIAYIKTAASTVPSTWDGPILPKINQFPKSVTAMAQPTRSMNRVCTSGSFSGVRCYGSVTDGGPHWLDSAGDTMGPYEAWLWTVESNVAGQSMGGPGDSGGPVFVPNGDNVTAIGMISGGPSEQFPAACTGEPTNRTGCSSHVYFADVYTEAWLNHDIDLRQAYAP